MARGREWKPDAWRTALVASDGDRQRARFDKEAADARPRRRRETDAERSARFAAEFSAASAQRQALDRAKSTVRPTQKEAQA